MPQLDPVWFYSQIFWLVISFSLLYLFLSRQVLPALSGTIQQRKQTVGSDIQAAESASNLADQAKHDYEHLLAQSREMSQALINEALDDNKRHREETLRLTDQDIVRKLTEASVRIKARKNELIHALTPAAAEFSSLIAEKITKQTVNIEQTSRMVMEIMKERGSLQ